MEWTVDYGDGPRPCTVPHAWRQDVDVRWEGPAIYRTSIEVDRPGLSLLFHGVSYHARVFLDDVLALEHCGIWDAFFVPLGSPGIPDSPCCPSTGKTVDVRVEVIKNGGDTFPVKEVLSGFLPYVYHTFGGIFREVEVVEDKSYGTYKTYPKPRVSVEGTKLFIDDKPWYMRGILSWGWYPEIGHPNPPIEVIRDEVRKVKALGFNLVKFCLWLPPHSYFQVLEEEDMWAWVEIPLWMPTGEEAKLEEMFDEVKRIVEQYRHHDRIVTWTCGCELSESTPHEYRKRLFEMVTELTGCPLVKDNSGGSEMYGGDLREYGTFYDFHPYCDTHFYPPVLESLQIGPRKKMPILLGEYNDYDVYRPIRQWFGPEELEVDPERPWIIRSHKANRPYWASSLPELNDKGVRWQHDLPDAIRETVEWEERSLERASRSKERFVRAKVMESVLACEDIAGFVQTGIHHTPISSSGVLDNCTEGNPTVPLLEFNEVALFRIPFRCPPWVNGGNRQGWLDSGAMFPGPNTLVVGARSQEQIKEGLRWVLGERRDSEASKELSAGSPSMVGSIDFEANEKTWQTQMWLGKGAAYWSFNVFERLKPVDFEGWRAVDPIGVLVTDALPKIEESRIRTMIIRTSLPLERDSNHPQLVLLGSCIDSTVVKKMPFWRESITDCPPGPGVSSWDWKFMYAVAPDCVIDPAWLESEHPDAEWLLTRIDTRTYERHPYIARKGKTVVTTLRPWGGLGAQPYGLNNNPAGCELLRILMRLAESG